MEDIGKYDSSRSFTSGIEVKNYLLETCKWAKFLAIVGYVGIGLIILMAFVVTIGVSFFDTGIDKAFDMRGIGLMYLVIAVVYFFPVNYLYRFSKHLKTGLIANDEGTISTGFENLKSLFKFMGIFTIVMLSLYALFLFILLPLSMLVLK
ncbi:hypothetical protein SAMN04488057_10213 [Cyclobacterium lianum]|uniref:DUF5362 domain-containing protein n=1 Tax=Cyclobacterium lianum TaxID=388280 RepID=A0A1M7JGY4_9BACT|nr:DUF5362 family protein [Cyclobacterium lianum]SHM52340.1 hypothetical protein SAMN04488057_10213 [Cyclobacterium lianum]